MKHAGALRLERFIQSKAFWIPNLTLGHIRRDTVGKSCHLFPIRHTLGKAQAPVTKGYHHLEESEFLSAIGDQCRTNLCHILTAESGAQMLVDLDKPFISVPPTRLWQMTWNVASLLKRTLTYTQMHCITHPISIFILFANLPDCYWSSLKLTLHFIHNFNQNQMVFYDQFHKPILYEIFLYKTAFI